jgi:8-oxo-dGTP diphosphatase
MNFYRNLSFSKPIQFKPTLDVVACFVEWNKKILLVKRHPEKAHGGTWCLPGGKVQTGEKIADGAVRELHEETGILTPSTSFSSAGVCYIASSEGDFTFHMFRLGMETEPLLTLALDEHTEAAWVTLDEAYRLPLITDGAAVLEHYRRLKV